MARLRHFKLGVVAWALVAALFMAAAPSAQADEFPSRVVTIVVPFDPGGSIDLVTRLIADRLGKRFRQPVVVQNMPGATGEIAVEHVAHAAPDGYTAVMAASAAVAINQHFSKLRYDSQRDLSFVTLTAMGPAALAVNASLPVNSVKEFIDYAKARPGQLSYGVSGVGSQLHLAMELFKLRAGLQMTAIPYKGTAPTTIALASGEVQAAISDLVSLQPQVDAKKVRILAVVDSTRVPMNPNIPTVAESGLPGYSVSSSWFGLFLPSGTPTPIVNRWYKDVDAVLETPDVKKAIMGMGVIPSPSASPAAATDFLRSQIQTWGDIIKATNVKLKN